MNQRSTDVWLKQNKPNPFWNQKQSKKQITMSVFLFLKIDVIGTRYIFFFYKSAKIYHKDDWYGMLDFFFF